MARLPLTGGRTAGICLTATDKTLADQGHASEASRSLNAAERLNDETIRAAARILENATLRGKSSAVWIGRDKAEWELSKTLREAAWIFENEKDGRFRGPIIACQAVAHFIYLRGGGAELAGPFGQIIAAFEYLKRGGEPTLFSRKKVSEKERSRSPERKHLHMLAAVCLEVLAQLGDSVAVATDSKASAADRVAAGVKRWPGMARNVKATTIVNWRKQYRRSGDRNFEAVVAKTMAEPDPRGAVEDLLQNGPHGQWRG